MNEEFLGDLTGEFVQDIDAIRKQARAEINQGALTDAYGADRARVINVLNTVLATELMCVLRYESHFFACMGTGREEEFGEHAREEADHARRIAKRILELDGIPDFNPEAVAQRAHTHYSGADSVTAMARQDLIAERIAIITYTEIIRWLGDKDPSTTNLMTDILAKEEEHALEMRRIMENG